MLRTASVLGAAALGGLGYSYWEAGQFRVTEERVDLAAGSYDLRVLHISDLHLLPASRLSRWLGTLIAQRPDLVIGTGDFIAHPDSVPALVGALGPLLDVPGAFVLGSNDYYAPVLRSPTRYLRPDHGRRHHGPELPWRELRGELARRGWVDLTNSRATIEVNGVLLDLAGVDDPHIGRDDYAAVAGRGSGDLHIGVTHAPYRRVLDAMAADAIDLVFAGHTHGGQLCLPGIGALVTNCDIPRGQASGLSRQASPVGPPPYGGRDGLGMTLHVSAGLGTSPFTPVRFACRPTATVVTLR